MKWIREDNGDSFKYYNLEKVYRIDFQEFWTGDYGDEFFPSIELLYKDDVVVKLEYLHKYSSNDGEVQRMIDKLLQSIPSEKR